MQMRGMEIIMKKTVKSFKKVVLGLLVLCQILTCLAACKSNGADDDSVESEEIIFELTKENLASYVIVVPENNAEGTAAANSIRGIIEKITGAKPEIKSDSLAESEFEILVGVANRKESKDFHENIKNDDYGYAMVGKKILILGHNSNALNQAVVQINVDVFTKAKTVDVLLKSGDKNIITGSYDYENLAINGVDISKYSIVYPKNYRNNEFDVAICLQKWIIGKTGNVLRVVDDSAEVSEYRINVGETECLPKEMVVEKIALNIGDDECYIGVDDNNLWLWGGNRSTIYTSFTKITNMITISNESLSLDIASSEAYVINSLNLSVMNYNVYYDLNESKRNPDDVVVSIQQRNPDVFGLNEAGLAWINKIDNAVNATYDYVSGKPADSAADASYNCIFYKKDKFDVVEWGTKWLSDTPNTQSKYTDAKHYKIFTYVIFRDKATDVEFMYLNTHLDGSNESDAHAALKNVRKNQAEVLKSFIANYGCLPVIVGGDFNEGVSSGVIAGMSNNTRLRYCANIAKKNILVNSTDVNSSYTAISDGVVFDYLFVTSDSISVQLYEQWDNKINGKYPADHLPVCAEISILF